MPNVIKNGNVFANKIDMSRLGGMGHSFGACTILKTSFVDSRFKVRPAPTTLNHHTSLSPPLLSRLHLFPPLSGSQLK